MPPKSKVVNKAKNKRRDTSTDEHIKSQRHSRIKVNAELSKKAKQNAHSIVLSLLEVGVSEEYFVEKIRYITPESYEDVIAERAIAEICGYPLCDSALEQKYGNQIYIIRHNKVYDITQRRNYCSHKCYEASELVLSQIPSIPLYLRFSDKEIQNFKFILPDVSKLKGRYGKLVNITGATFDLEEDLVDVPEPSQRSKRKSNSKKSPSSKLNNTANETASSVSTESSINISTSEENSSYKTNDSSSHFGLSPSRDSFQDSTSMSVDSDVYLSEEAQKLSLSESYESKNASFKDDRPACRSDGKEIIQSTHCSTEKLNRDENEREVQRKSSLESIYEKPTDQYLTDQIEHALREWMTFESLRMILGDQYVKGMLEELGRTWEDYDTTAGLRLGVEGKSKYISLCKKLDEDEIRERTLDASDCSIEADGTDEKLELKSVPNYEQLKQDVQQTSLKVRAFYEGREEEVVNFKEKLETIPEEEGEHVTEVVQKKKKKKGKSEEEKESEIDSLSLPLIDNYSQKTWRRQIVVERVSKPLSCYVCDFGLDEAEIRRLLISLIATFDLSAHNISFKTNQWKFVTLVLLKMLSVRYPVIEETIIPGGRGFDHVTSTLAEAGLDPDYLSRLLSYLTEISYILTKYHKEIVPNYNTNTLLEEPRPKPQVTGDHNNTEAVRESTGTKDSLLNGKKVTHTSDSRNSNEDFTNVDANEGKPFTNYEELD